MLSHSLHLVRERFLEGWRMALCILGAEQILEHNVVGDPNPCPLPLRTGALQVHAHQVKPARAAVMIVSAYQLYECVN